MQGVSHITTQLVVLREMLAVYSGNELVVGVLLSSWLLLMGLGAALGRKSGARTPKPATLVSAQIALGVLPPATVVALRTLRNVVFVRGAELGLGETLASSTLLLLPYCLTAGYSLTLMARAFQAARPSAAPLGPVYVADGIGDTLGGLLFGLVLLHFGDHFITLLGVGALSGTAAAWFGWSLGSRRLALAGAAAAAVLVTVGATVDLDRITLAPLYPGQRIVEHASSPYGDLVVTESAGQHDLWSNSTLLGTAHDQEQAEETVHFAMAQRPHAERVLLVGGAASGVAQEILRYPVKAVDGVELDPLVIELARRYARGSSDPRLQWIPSDGRAFVRQSLARYDVVIVDLPDPATLQHNRYYTREFFREVDRVLRPGGVLGLSIGHYADYVSPELGRLLAITRQSLAGVFPEVQVVPTSRVGVLASHAELRLDITERLAKEGIRTEWLGPAVIAATLAPDRVRELDQASRVPASVNRDLDPVLEVAALSSWLGRFELGVWPWIVLGGSVLLVAALAFGRTALTVATVGFATSGLEVLLLLGMAVAEGAVYGKAFWVVTTFLMGSTAGAWMANRSGRGGRRALASAGVLLGLVALLSRPALAWVIAPGTPAWATGLAFPGLAALVGGLAGSAFVFALSSEPSGGRALVARLYAADLGGAALGALVTGTLLLPCFGADGAGIVVAALCLVGALSSGLGPRREGRNST